MRYNTHTHTYTHTYTHTTNRVCARANARFEFNAVQIVQTRRRRASEGGGERIEFFSFCHHHPFDPAFADILSLPPSGKKRERQSIGRSRHRKGWMRHSGRAAREEGGMWRERGEKKKICSRRDASVRLGSARLRSARSTGNFQSAFRVSAFEEGGRGREGGMSVFASPC